MLFGNDPPRSLPPAAALAAITVTHPTVPIPPPTLTPEISVTPIVTRPPSPTETPLPSDTLPPPSFTPTVISFTGHIVFVSYRDGDDEIYVMNADGSNQTRLTYSLQTDYEPMLSPDGTRVVFVTRRDGNFEIYSMLNNGGDQRNISNAPRSSEFDPYWSPDSRQIVFSSNRGGNFDLWIMDSDGANPRRLTSNPDDENFPAWSPDGEWITYNSVNGDEDIVKIVRADGSSDSTLLERDEAYVTGWIGGRILLVVPDESTTDIYSMAPDASGFRPLTSDPANDKGGYGTPDGAFVVFSSSRDGNDEIYVMRADGLEQTRLTFTPANDYMPAWGP